MQAKNIIANLHFALEEEHLQPQLLARLRAMLDAYPQVPAKAADA